MLISPMIILGCSLLGYVLASPTQLSTLASSHGTLANAPSFLQFDKDNSGVVRYRRMLEARAPEMQSPFPGQMIRHDTNYGIPSPEETELIKNFLKNAKAGMAYKLHEDGTITPMPKSDFTLQYVFGKIEFYNGHEILIYETKCCYGNPQNKDVNCAEGFCDCCIPVVGCFTLYGCVAWLRDYIKSHCCTGIPGDTSTLATAPEI
ncbi:hypothetical protein PSTT_10921 [Puccinia striiformis]|uniref:EF-hand domain-containing protein n=1 Tax=Puccinia striiformis TaxID=27350 RepID=A0A2S4V2E1_9BASI|nr:hypothetical protein PSTT_10921 [Puccinia striiformis]